MGFLKYFTALLALSSVAHAAYFPQTTVVQTNPSLLLGESLLHDANGNPIYATSNALNSYITNSTLTFSNTSFAIAGTLPAFAATPTFNLGTLNGAATAVNQSAMISDLDTLVSKVGSPFQVGGVIGNTSFGISGTLPAFASPPTVYAAQSGSWTINATNPSVNATNGAVPLQATQVGGSDGTDLRALSVNSSGQLNINNVSGTVSLPTGAATDATLSSIKTSLGSPLQQTGGSVTANAGVNLNTSALALESGGNLAAINAKTPALGQALASGSTPVVLPASQLSALTPYSTVTANQGGAPWSVTATQYGTWNVGVSSLPAVTGTVTANAGTGTFQTNITNSFLPVSQSGSWTEVATQPTAANLNATVVTTGGGTIAQDSTLNAVKTALGTPFQAGGAISNTTFGASQSGAWTVGRNWNLSSSTDSVTIAGSVTATNSANGNPGAATPAQATQIGGSDGTDLRTLSVNSSGQLNINNVSGTVSLPTGAATDLSVQAVKTALGTPFQAGGSIGNTSFAATQSTAANLNATVVGPSGAALAKDSTLSTINTTLGSPFQAGGSIGNTSFGISGLLPAFASPPTVSATQSGAWGVTATQATGSNLHTVVDSGTITVGASTLPTGAATSALQATGNGYLSTLATNIPAQGQALAAASLPVVLPVSQITALTPPTTVAVTQSTGTNLHTVVDASALPTGAATATGVAAVVTALGSPFQAGGSIGNTSFGISGTLPAFAATPTFNLGNLNGAATNASLTAINTTLGSPMQQTGGSLSVTNFPTSFTVNQGTSPWNVSGSITTSSLSDGIPGTAIPADATMVGGSDGTNLQALSVNTLGQLNLNNISGTISLPTGAATAANQATQITSLSTINTTLGSPFQAGGSIGNTSFGSTQSGTWTVGLSSGTNTIGSLNNISGTISLPTGAATSALQATGNTALSSIVTNTTGLATASNQATANGSLATIATNTTPVAQGSTTSGQSGSLSMGAVTTAAPTYTTAQTSPLSLTIAGALRVDGSAVTQPISAASLPLPSGAATATGVAAVVTALGSPFQAGGSIGNTSFGATQSGTWSVGLNAGTNTIGSLNNISGTISLPTGAATAANQATQITSLATINTTLGSPFQAGGSIGNTSFGATQSGTWSVGLNAGSNNIGSITNVTGTVSLPTGASTSALQATGNGYLSTLATNLPPQGQALASASTPVVLPASQISTLTPPTSVSLNAGSQVIGSISNTTFTATQATGTNLHTVVDSGTVTATISGTPNVAVTSSVLPTGAATATGVAAVVTALGSPFQAGGSIGNTSFAATQATAANLNATVVGTGGSALATSALQSTANTSLSAIQTSVANIPASPSTAALQTTGNGTLSSILTALGSPFQAGGSIGNTSFAATQTTAANLNATVVGTGGTTLATSALQTTGNTALSAIQTSVANIPTSPSTAGNQATEITSLGTIATNTANTNTSVQNTQGSVAAGTAATKSGLIGLTYNSTLPTLTTGQQASAQADSSGRLLTNGSGVVQPVSTKVTLTGNSPTNYTATTTTGLALAANTSRHGLIITNVGAGTVYLGLGTAAISGSGITLLPGGVWSMDEYSFTQQAINAIATVSSSITIQEFQ